MQSAHASFLSQDTSFVYYILKADKSVKITSVKLKPNTAKHRHKKN